MKNIPKWGVVLIGAVVVTFLVVLLWPSSDDCNCENGNSNCACEAKNGNGKKGTGIDPRTTQVTVVRHDTGQEMIVSEYGENQATGSGKMNMNDRVKTIAQDLLKSGRSPAMEYKVYNGDNQLMATGVFDPNDSTRLGGPGGVNSVGKGTKKVCGPDTVNTQCFLGISGDGYPNYGMCTEMADGTYQCT